MIYIVNIQLLYIENAWQACNFFVYGIGDTW